MVAEEKEEMTSVAMLVRVATIHYSLLKTDVTIVT